MSSRLLWGGDYIKDGGIIGGILAFASQSCNWLYNIECIILNIHSIEHTEIKHPNLLYHDMLCYIFYIFLNNNHKQMKGAKNTFQKYPFLLRTLKAVGKKGWQRRNKNEYCESYFLSKLGSLWTRIKLDNKDIIDQWLLAFLSLWEYTASVAVYAYRLYPSTGKTQLSWSPLSLHLNLEILW